MNIDSAAMAPAAVTMVVAGTIPFAAVGGTFSALLAAAAPAAVVPDEAPPMQAGAAPAAPVPAAPERPEVGVTRAEAAAGIMVAPAVVGAKVEAPGPAAPANPGGAPVARTHPSGGILVPEPGHETRPLGGDKPRLAETHRQAETGFSGRAAIEVRATTGRALPEFPDGLATTGAPLDTKALPVPMADPETGVATIAAAPARHLSMPLPAETPGAAPRAARADQPDGSADREADATQVPPDAVAILLPPTVHTTRSDAPAAPASVAGRPTAPPGVAELAAAPLAFERAAVAALQSPARPEAPRPDAVPAIVDTRDWTPEPAPRPTAGVAQSMVLAAPQTAEKPAAPPITATPPTVRPLHLPEAPLPERLDRRLRLPEGSDSGVALIPGAARLLPNPVFDAPAPAVRPAVVVANTEMAVASDALGEVRIGIEGSPRDLKVSIGLAPASAAIVAADVPRLVADLAANGVRLQSLDISGGGAFGGGQPDAQPNARREALRRHGEPVPLSPAAASNQRLSDRYA